MVSFCASLCCFCFFFFCFYFFFVVEDAESRAGGKSSSDEEPRLAGVSSPLQAVRMPAAEQAARPSRKLRREILAFFIRRSSYNKIVVFIDRSPAECYNSFRVLWIGEALLPQRRFLGGSNHSFFVEMLIS